MIKVINFVRILFSGFFFAKWDKNGGDQYGPELERAKMYIYFKSEIKLTVAESVVVFNQILQINVYNYLLLLLSIQK